MLRTMLKSEIHRATVTRADLDHVGSVTVDRDLMDAADLLEGERVVVVELSGGARLATSVIAGERGSGVLGINGAAAHLVHPGDLVVLLSHGLVDDAECRTWVPRVVLVDADNRVVVQGGDPSHAPAGSGPGPVVAGLANGGLVTAEEAETPDATRLDALISADPEPGTTDPQPTEA